MTGKAKGGRIILKSLIVFFFAFSALLSIAVYADTTPAATVNNTTVKNDSAPPLAKKPQLGYRKNYTSPQKISLNFTSIKTRELLQIFSQFADKNFIISDKVQGSMSIHLKNIPWPQALHAILQSQGLGRRNIGETVIIAPAADIAAEEIQEITNKQQMAALKTKSQVQELESQNQIANLQPLNNKIVRLRYSKAEDVEKLLTGTGNLLSDRGKIGVDVRTNAVWVRDTPSHVRTVVRLIKQLDFALKQVIIEARIVKLQRPYEQSFGIKWGVSSSLYHLSGSLDGANYGLTNNLNTLTPIVNNGTSLANRLNFDMRAAALNNGTILPATAGLALGKIGNVNIDAEISALQYGGKAEMISQPKLITSDGKPAYIANGEEIPYAAATSSGATSIEYKNAELRLEVTPHITSDKRVMLKIKVTNNTQGALVQVGTLGGQALAINTEEEESEVLLNNNQTVVIGGIYTRDKQKFVTRIPFLGSLPLVGYFFKHTFIRDNRDELIVFLTPHIVRMPKSTKKE